MVSVLKILGINGSCRDGHTDKLLSRALESARKRGAEIKMLTLPSPGAKYELLEYDGVIFATPVHWFNVSATMKDFIDSLTLPLNSDEDFANSPYPLDGIVAGFIAGYTVDGAQQAINAMMAPLNHMGMIVMPFASAFYNIDIKDGSVAEIDDLGKRMVEFIECLDY